MVIGIARTVALILHHPGGRIQDVLGRHQAAGLARSRARRLVGGVDRVRLGREGKVDHRLGQRQFALGGAKAFVGLPSLQTDCLRLRVGQADVLDRHAGDASGEEAGVLSPFQHPGEPVKCCVGVAAAHRFVQRRDQVVMLIPRFVVFRRTAHQALRKLVAGQALVNLPSGDLLDQVQKRPAVAIGHLQHRLARLALQRQGAAQFLFGPLRQALQVGKREPLQHDDLRAGQKCCVQFETGVLGRGTDQKDRPILHMRQEPVLLRLVEAVNLVHEQQRALAVLPPQPGGLEHFAQFRDAGEDRRDLDEMQVRLVRQKPGDGGLAHPGRPPQHQGGQGPRRQHCAQRPVARQHLVLADHLGQRLWPQPVGQRAGTAVGTRGHVEKIGHGTTLAGRVSGLKPEARTPRPAVRQGSSTPCPQPHPLVVVSQQDAARATSPRPRRMHSCLRSAAGP